MNQVFSSIRIRIFLLLGLSFVVMLATSAYVAYIERQDSLASALANLQQNAMHIANEQDKVIDYAQQLLLLLASRNLPEIAPGSRCPESFGQILRSDSRMANVGMASTDGNIICNASASANMISIGDRDYFRNALKTAQPVIGNAVRDRSSAKWTLPFARAIRNESGNVEGVLAVWIDLSWVNRELQKARLPPGARIGLIDGMGTVLARYPDPENWVGKNAALTPFFTKLLLMGGQGTAEEIGFDKVKRIYAFAHFAQTTAGPIYLWIGVSRESVTKNADDKFILILLVLLALSVSSFGTIWLGGERLLLRPVSQLAEAARRLGEGDYSARSALAGSNDELGQLARSFDKMASDLLSKSEVLRLNRALRVLSACGSALIRMPSENELLCEVCRIIVEMGYYRMAWVGFCVQDEQKSVRVVAQNGFDEGYLEHAGITWADNERGRGPTGTVARTGVAQVNQNFATNPALAPWRAEALKRGFASSAALPLKDETGVFGAVTIYSADADAFNAEEMTLLGELADDLAFGIHYLRIRAEHEGDMRKLQASMEKTIQSLATVLEMRDPYAAGHQRRVASLVEAIATELGLSAEEIHGMKLAGLIHDVGKIRVPADILAKSAVLSDIEYRLVMEHAQAGFEILRDIDFPWPIAELVRQHHERLDGSGYPQGLVDEEIIFGAKIIAVADTVEAMSFHRPYREAPGIDAALAEIGAGRGMLYDPAVADACIRIFRRGNYSFPG